MSGPTRAWVAATGLGLGAMWVGGCGAAERSSCAEPASAPVTLSGGDRRDPVIASDGGGRLVAVWESLTGGGLEASTRDDTGTWSPARTLSGPYARDPAVAVDPDGRAIAAWQAPMSADTTAVQVAVADAAGAWGIVTDVSPAGVHAREPQIAQTGDGTALLVWRRDTGGGDTVMEVSERLPDGVWGAALPLSDPTVRSKRPRLAAGPDGSAVLVWEQGTGDHLDVVAVTRAPDGQWSQPVTLTGTAHDGHEPDVAIGPMGAAIAVWIADVGDHAALVAASRPAAATWSVPVEVGRGSAEPYETPRPGRAETGADVAVLPDGRAVAAWTIVEGDVNRARSAMMSPEGVWTAPALLSGPGRPASGVQVAALAGGVVAVGWEELDGGLIRARVARLSSEGAPAACIDLTPARAESGAVRLVGGSAPSAVFVDFNRSRVQVAPIP